VQIVDPVWPAQAPASAVIANHIAVMTNPCPNSPDQHWSPIAQVQIAATTVTTMAAAKPDTVKIGVLKHQMRQIGIGA
jgi:hypothetical protein